MRILVTLLLIFAVLFTVSAQKTSRSEVKSDFTTTPFQYVSAAKGVSTITEGYYEVEDGEYTEGEVTIKIPFSFNPSNKEKFTFDNQAIVTKMIIYDMNGKKVYEGKMKNSWNGKSQNGEITSIGLYIYTVDAQITPNQVSKLTGFVRILK